jgi:ankyrin repeat protein
MMFTPRENTPDGRPFIEDVLFFIREAENGHALSVEDFLRMYPDYVDARNELGETALMLASKSGHVRIVQNLLDHAANINILNSSGQSALFYAVLFCKPEIADMLLRAGGQPGQADTSGVSPAAYLQNFKEVKALQSLQEVFTNHAARQREIMIEHILNYRFSWKPIKIHIRKQEKKPDPPQA